MGESEIIEIDGSIGGGQVLRTAIALSALTMKPIRIFNIRKNRPKPGLAAQHLMGVKIAAEFCDADVEGLSIGSTEIKFSPKRTNVPSHKIIDIRTSGSIPLLLQTLTPICIFAGKDVMLDITGGTSGKGAPNIAYLQHVTFPILLKLGVPMPEIEIVKQGFYPCGGGRVKMTFHPAEKLKAVDLTTRGAVKHTRGVSIAGSLPSHVSERQAKAAEEYLRQKGFDAEKVRIERQNVQTFSSGTSITLWAECEHSVLGADAIGEIKVPAETIGKRAAKELVESIESSAALDRYMADQILPFIVLAEGKSEITVEKITEHCKTNMRIIEKLLPVKFDAQEKDKKISANGVGL